jgi:hypothetical protein
LVEHTVEARGVDGSNPSVPIALRGTTAGRYLWGL